MFGVSVNHAVGDLAGFVAATYLRGVRWVQVPTTLLAQVDAAIGGKTGINHRFGKNLIGAFHQPQFVLTDPELLQTLPERQRFAGLAEVIKYGLIHDERFFTQLETTWDGCLEDRKRSSTIIERSIEIKSEIVSRDEREVASRALLNFGHTIGHALEAATKYQHFLHGEAVAWGMLAEAYISYKKQGLTAQDFERIAALLRRLPRPAFPPSLEMEPFLEYIHRDKKARHKQIWLVLLQGFGKAALSGVMEVDIREAFEYLRASS